jgi:hypothetical protein
MKKAEKSEEERLSWAYDLLAQDSEVDIESFFAAQAEAVFDRVLAKIPSGRPDSWDS